MSRDEYTPISNADRKRILAREHNRKYDAGEPTHEVESLEQSVKRIVSGFQENVVKQPKSKKQKRWK